jgi:hypothetical protein
MLVLIDLNNHNAVGQVEVDIGALARALLVSNDLVMNEWLSNSLAEMAHNRILLDVLPS